MSLATILNDKGTFDNFQRFLIAETPILSLYALISRQRDIQKNGF